MYNVPELERALAGSVFAGKLHYAPQTASTNSDALEAARRDAPHGSVFFADEQTAGRGRGDHAWSSPAGEGLYVSLLLRTPIPAQHLPLLPLAVGLAAAEAVQAEAGVILDLRWPNDLLIGPRKVGGILVESKITEQCAAYAVVGVGINVHQRRFDPNLATPATSLVLESAQPQSRSRIFLSLIKSIEREALALLQPANALAVPLRLEASSSWIRGRAVTVHGPQACAGITDGLDSNGCLRVRTDAGVVLVQTGGIRAA